MEIRHLFGISMLIIIIFLVGCAPKMTCESPNVMIGTSCCLDDDGDDQCDDGMVTQEPVEKKVVEPEVQTADEETEAEPAMAEEEEFAREFEDLWNKKNFNALYARMELDYQRKFSKEEFNFFMKRIDAKVGIESVSFKAADPQSADYIIQTDKDKEKVTGGLIRERGQFHHKPFYIFEDPEVTDACDDERCFFDYAKLSGNQNVCEMTGNLSEECQGYFGVAKGMIAKIDKCIDIKEYYGQADCLTELAEDEKDIEPCWNIEYDKQKYECMGKVAAIDEDAALCRKFVDSRTIPATRQQHAYCILGYVSKTLDNSVCHLIDRKDDVVVGAMAENCDMMRFN